MAKNDITVKLRLLGAKKFDAEARNSAREIDNLGDAARRADLKAKAASIMQATQTGAAALASKMDGFFKKITGGITPMKALIALAIPMAPALFAIGSSALAAGAGLGVLGLAAGAVAASGLGGVFLVTKGIATNFKNVTTALDAYNMALAQNGMWAKSTIAAHKHLLAVVGQSGGQQILNAVKAWKALGDSFKKLTAPATKALLGLFNMALGSAKKIMPIFAQVTNNSVAALVAAFRGPLRALSGGEAQRGLRFFGDIFAKIVGPVTRAAMSVFTGLMRVAQAAAPYLIGIASSAERGAKGFASWASSGADGFVRNVVGQLQTWWNLADALGGVMVTLLKGSAKTGQGLVVSLTGILDRFNGWLNTTKGQKDMHKFFTDSAKLVRLVFKAFGPLILAFAQLSGQLLPVLRAYLGFLITKINLLTGAMKLLGPAVGPVVNGLIIMRAALAVSGGLLVGAARFGKALKFIRDLCIGTRIQLALLGAQAFAGKIISQLARVRVAFAALTGVAGTSGTASGSAFARGLAGGLLAGTVGLGAALGAAINKLATDAIDKVLGISRPSSKGTSANGMSTLPTTQGFEPLSFLTDHLPGFLKPGHAQGGFMKYGNMSLVGEQGPELASFGTHGVNIIPASGTQTKLRALRPKIDLSGMIPQPTAPAEIRLVGGDVYLDGKAVGRHMIREFQTMKGRQ
jgi:hypothetical protein